VLLVDDILFFPVSSLLWIFREIHNTALEEQANESESITQQLRSLYMQLETGGITEEVFDLQEKVLLDRLDAIEARKPPPEDEEAE
jgi:hypothetical protein